MPASPTRVSARARLLVAAALVPLATGCSSLLSTAALRDGIWAGEEHASEAAVPVSDVTAEQPGESPAVADAAADGRADEARRAAAIEEAVGRLARAGRLDDAARDVLIDTLERTAPEDWPAVVEAFTESLPPAAAEPAETAPLAASAEPPAADATAPETHVVAKADLDGGDPGGSTPADAPPPPPQAPAPDALVQPEGIAPPVTTPAEPAPPEAPEPPAAPVPETLPTPGQAAAPGAPPSAADSAPAEPGRQAPEPAPPRSAPEPTGPGELAVRNACFATRVQAWGVVDRFAADRFRPGQELIVYFELDHLSSGETAAGHTTCIDSTLELVGPGGETVHAWRFEPIAETCQAKRRDYFARYVVRVPDGVAPGAYRVAVTVTDTLAGAQASASLPLEIVPAAE